MEEKLKNEIKLTPLYPPHQALRSTTPLNHPPLTILSVTGVKRKMPPKMRLNSKQAHVTRKESVMMKLHYNDHFKKATQFCTEEAKKPKKQRKSAEKIVREINEKENVKICPKTVWNYISAMAELAKLLRNKVRKEALFIKP
jgi:hypothetical protein